MPLEIGNATGTSGRLGQQPGRAVVLNSVIAPSQSRQRAAVRRELGRITWASRHFKMQTAKATSRTRYDTACAVGRPISGGTIA